MWKLRHSFLAIISILTLYGCGRESAITVLFTSDVKGRIKPAG